MKSGIAVLAIATTLLTACAADDPHRRAKSGAAIGAVAGAVIGHQVDGRNGRFVGAAVGALTGAAVGDYMDRQQRQLNQRLAGELADRDIRIVRIDKETLKLELNSEATFDVNSSGIRSDFRDSLDKVASVISEYDKTAVHVVGHTDSTGSESYNQRLSEQRADSVGRYMSRNGVTRNRMRLSGRGELQPIADNDTRYGRAQNRRVEIYLKPFVQGRESQAYQPPA